MNFKDKYFIVQKVCVSFSIRLWNKLFGQSIISFWRRQWHPTPVLLPEKSHGQRSPAGYSPWGHRVKHD